MCAAPNQAYRTVLEPTGEGLFCPAGGFYVDPWRAVDRAIITHGHADHARPGSSHYLTATPGAAVLRHRLGANAPIETLDYGEQRTIGDVTVSLHPAGHLLGSAQVRLEYRGHVVVVSGDYKRDVDATCTPFEPVRCDTFISECTFGLPIYRWPAQQEIIAQIHQWWQTNQQRGRNSILFAYSLGKAQRVLAQLDPDVGPIFAHGAVKGCVDVYREAGIALPDVADVKTYQGRQLRGGALVVAPPAALGSVWLRRFAPYATGFVSGWMQVRGQRRWRHVDRGFVISDHVDWPGLLQTIDDTEAETIGLTHGYVDTMKRWLCENGRNAVAIATRYVGEADTNGMEENASTDADATSEAPLAALYDDDNESSMEGEP